MERESSGTSEAPSATVSFRLPTKTLERLKELELALELQKSTIMRRLVEEGVAALWEHRELYGTLNWPRSGGIQMSVVPDAVGIASHPDLKKLLRDLMHEILAEEEGLPGRAE